MYSNWGGAQNWNPPQFASRHVWAYRNVRAYWRALPVVAHFWRDRCRDKYNEVLSQTEGHVARARQADEIVDRILVDVEHAYANATQASSSSLAKLKVPAASKLKSLAQIEAETDASFKKHLDDEVHEFVSKGVASGMFDDNDHEFKRFAGDYFKMRTQIDADAVKDDMTADEFKQALVVSDGHPAKANGRRETPFLRHEHRRPWHHRHFDFRASLTFYRRSLDIIQRRVWRNWRRGDRLYRKVVKKMCGNWLNELKKLRLDAKEVYLKAKNTYDQALMDYNPNPDDTDNGASTNQTENGDMENNDDETFVQGRTCSLDKDLQASAMAERARDRLMEQHDAEVKERVLAAIRAKKAALTVEIKKHEDGQHLAQLDSFGSSSGGEEEEDEESDETDGPFAGNVIASQTTTIDPTVTQTPEHDNDDQANDSSIRPHNTNEATYTPDWARTEVNSWYSNLYKAETAFLSVYVSRRHWWQTVWDLRESTKFSGYASRGRKRMEWQAHKAWQFANLSEDVISEMEELGRYWSEEHNNHEE